MTGGSITIDCNRTDEIVCPHCGHEFSDSAEYGRGEDVGELECGECEKAFFARRNITVDYTSMTLEARRGP